MGLFVLAGLAAGLIIGFFFGRQAMKAMPQQVPDAPGYIVVLGKNYEAKDMMPYVESLPPIYEKYEGNYAMMSTNVEQLEGKFDYQSILVSKWPSADKAREFWHSEEYTEAKKLRDGVGEFDIFLVEGFKMPS